MISLLRKRRQRRQEFETWMDEHQMHLRDLARNQREVLSLLHQSNDALRNISAFAQALDISERVGVGGDPK